MLLSGSKGLERMEDGIGWFMGNPQGKRLLSRSHAGVPASLDPTCANCIQGNWFFRIESLRELTHRSLDHAQPGCATGPSTVHVPEACERPRSAVVGPASPSRSSRAGADPDHPGGRPSESRIDAANGIRPDWRRGRIGSAPECATKTLRAEFGQHVPNTVSSCGPSTGMPCQHLTCEVTGHKVWPHVQDQRI